MDDAKVPASRHVTKASDRKSRDCYCKWQCCPSGDGVVQAHTFVELADSVFEQILKAERIDFD